MVAPSQARRTALYRFFDASDVLLYVGISVNPKVRDYHHARQSAWWPKAARKEICWYDTWPEADAAETAAIAIERPLYNIAGATGPVVRLKTPRPGRREMSPVIKARLRDAAEVCRRARSELLAAILEAADNGETSVEIARAIDFFYSPDYVCKLIRQHRGKRKGGRRPRPRTDDS